MHNMKYSRMIIKCLATLRMMSDMLVRARRTRSVRPISNHSPPAVFSASLLLYPLTTCSFFLLVVVLESQGFITLGH